LKIVRVKLCQNNPSLLYKGGLQAPGETVAHGYATNAGLGGRKCSPHSVCATRYQFRGIPGSDLLTRWQCVICLKRRHLARSSSVTQTPH